MKLTLLVAASALVLSACTGQGARAVAKLECPSSEGDLTRVSAAGDGKSCVYRSSDGAEVVLELVALKGDAHATLAAIEKQLVSEAGLVAPETPAPGTTPASDSAAADAAKAQAEALADSGGDQHVRHRGFGVTASDGPEGESARVDLPGIHIVANDGVAGDGDNAKVEIGPLKIDASDDDTTVRLYRDVRLRGEAFSREKRGIRATFIYTGKDLPAGLRYVGYQAGGPKTGPLTVAKIRTKDGTVSGDNINGDVEELVRRNGGV